MTKIEDGREGGKVAGGCNEAEPSAQPKLGLGSSSV